MGKFSARLALGMLVLPGLTAAQVRLIGQAVDDTKVAVARANIAVAPQRADEGTAASAVRSLTRADGSFVLELPEPGSYELHAWREGYFALEGLSLELSAGDNEVIVVPHHLRELHESIEVAYSPPAIEFEQTSAEAKVTGNDILFVPYPSSHSLQNALRIMPGAVVQDPQGEVHFNGGASDQTFWTLDGFNITDPLTGRFDTQLSVEAARSVKLSTGRYSAEFGKGSAGALALETGMGDDEFRYSATNFVPGLETRKGLTIGDWRPRVNLSGPVVKGRAWFFNAATAQYNKHIVEKLPEGQDRTTSYRVSNLLRGQVNLTRSNILYPGFLVTSFNAPRTGLSVLDPRETTVDLRSRQYFFYIKDQHYFGRGFILETGYARNSTFGRQIPQGHGLYILTPQGRQGNFFIDARRWSERHQWLANALLPSFSLGGEHQIKAGVDFNRLEYRQDIQRTGFERRRLDGTPIRQVLFAGDGRFERSNFETAWYLQDAWKPRPNLLVEAGVRQDRDDIIRNLTTSPRVAVNWSPFGRQDTKLSGGYAIVYDATSLRTFTRHLDQQTLTTYFDRAGQVDRGPLVTLFTLDRPVRKPPRYENWTLGVEQRLPGNFFARGNYLRKRGRDGFTFVNTLGANGPDIGDPAAFGGEDFSAVFGLRNRRNDVFDSFEMTVRRTFRKQYVWLASYTRSRALSDAALDISIDNPVLVGDNFGPMPWDSPHRFLSWAYFPLTKKWALAYMFEWRSGFPFSVENEEGSIIGPVNSRRFPDFFELNLQAERKLTVLGHRWGFRFGFVNLTGSQNPTVVNNNIDSPNFLQYSGGTSRALVTRLRWLGKVKDE